jgi:hypothetical protein
LRELEHKLARTIKRTGVGEYDGDEIAVDLSDVVLYMYGPDADRLFSAIRPDLESTSFAQGAVATLRYGPPQEGVRETNVTIVMSRDRR